MVLFQNILIALVSAAVILISRKALRRSPEKYMRIHIRSLFSRLVIIGLLIIVFAFVYPGKKTLLITSGIGTLVVFHFLEGFIIQRELLKGGNHHG